MKNWKRQNCKNIILHRPFQWFSKGSRVVYVLLWLYLLYFLGKLLKSFPLSGTDTLRQSDLPRSSRLAYRDDDPAAEESGVVPPPGGPYFFLISARSSSAPHPPVLVNYSFLMKSTTKGLLEKFRFQCSDITVFINGLRPKGFNTPPPQEQCV